MRIEPSRILFFENFMFNNITKKADIKMNVSFMNDSSLLVNNNMLKAPIADMELRGNLPCLRQIKSALADMSIKFIYSPTVTSGITFIPLMDTSKKQIIGVRVNLSKYAKKKAVVNTVTGDMTEVLNIPYELFYTLCFGALCVLKTQKLLLNPRLVKLIRTVWVDIVQQILNRTFGNPIYGDKFRFVLSYFFHDGEIPAKDLANVTGFDIQKAGVLENTYPEFFGNSARGTLNIEMLLEVISTEFPNMKDVSLDKFRNAAIVMLGEGGFYIVDNIAYLMGALAVRCRKEGREVFGGMLFKSVDADKAQILNQILQSL